MIPLAAIAERYGEAWATDNEAATDLPNGLFLSLLLWGARLRAAVMTGLPMRHKCGRTLGCRTFDLADPGSLDRLDEFVREHL